MRWLLAALLVFSCARADDLDSILRYKTSLPPSANECDHVNTAIPAYISSGRDAALETLQCPIPKSDRVKNYTGIQCVWSSIETLGRWAREDRLTKPPLTSRKDCKSYSGPALSAKVLNSLGVRFKQTYGDKRAGLDLIRQAMSEGRGALFDVPGHAMVVIHFDEAGDRVCWIDNSDNTLKAQTSTVQRFMSRWGSWVLVIYPEDGVAPYRAYVRRIPFFERDAGMTPNFLPVPD